MNKLSQSISRLLALQSWRDNQGLYEFSVFVACHQFIMQLLILRKGEKVMSEVVLVIPGKSEGDPGVL